MNKSNLKVVDHKVLPDQKTIEVWYKGKLVAAVYGADGPGIRIITKHSYDIVRGGLDESLNVVEVRVEIDEDMHER